MAERGSTHQHSGADCYFCTAAQDQRPSFETKSFYGIFDNFPVSPGHLEVIPKKHVVGMLDLKPGEWAELGKAVQIGKDFIEGLNLKGIYEEKLRNPVNEQSLWFVERALEHARMNTTPDGYNYGVNDGTVAGRTVDHFHLHIIPRYEGDMEDPRGGVRHVIPEMGNYNLKRT